MECSQLPSVASVRRPRDQSKLEQTKAQRRKPHSISSPELRIYWADHNPAPGAQDRVRRVFTMLLRHAPLRVCLSAVRIARCRTVKSLKLMQSTPTINEMMAS